jgi:GDPmannose 4,6-dehydratase
MPLRWEGEGESEHGIEIASGKTLVRVDPRYFRPTEVDLLLGDPSKARERLGWVPEVSFDGLVKLMVDADRERIQRKMHRVRYEQERADGRGT